MVLTVFVLPTTLLIFWSLYIFKDLFQCDGKLTLYTFQCIKCSYLLLCIKIIILGNPNEKFIKFNIKVSEKGEVECIHADDRKILRGKAYPEYKQFTRKRKVIFVLKQVSNIYPRFQLSCQQRYHISSNSSRPSNRLHPRIDHAGCVNASEIQHTL